MSTTVSDICDEGKPVTWAPIRELYKQLIDDQIANGYGSPGSPSSNLMLNTYSPFYMESTYATDMAIHFDVVDGVSITNVYLTRDGTDVTPWILPDSLAGLASIGRLYFVSEADNCWCKTMWKVVTPDDMSTFRLLELQTEDDDKQCCQTIHVPIEGESIPNLFIPANSIRAASSVDSGIETIISAPKCRNSSTGITLGVSNKTVVWAARNLTGYFTWPILPTDFYSIFSGITDMLFYACGGQPGRFWSASTGDETLTPYITDVIYTMSYLGYPETSIPGCIESESFSYNLPWDVDTCGEDLTCSPAGKRVLRCSTVKSLKRIIEYLLAYLIKGSCYATLDFTYYRKDGVGCACYAYYGLPLYRHAVYEYTCDVDSYTVTVSIDGPRTTNDFADCNPVTTESTADGPPPLTPSGCDFPDPTLTDEVTCTEIFEAAKSDATSWSPDDSATRTVAYGTYNVENTFYSTEYSSCDVNPQQSNVTYRKLAVQITSLPAHRVIRLEWRIKDVSDSTVSSGTEMMHMGDSFEKSADSANQAVEFTTYHEYEP